MSEQVKLYVSKDNLVDRSKPIKEGFIPAGTPFDPSFMPKDSFDTYLKVGIISEYAPEEEIVEDFVVDAPEKEEAPEKTEEELLKELKAEAKERFGVTLTQRKLETAQEKFDELVAAEAKKEAPQGIFNCNVEELAEMTLDELDAKHADICAEHDLPAPDPFKDIEEGIEKLTSEA